MNSLSRGYVVGDLPNIRTPRELVEAEYQVVMTRTEIAKNLLANAKRCALDIETFITAQDAHAKSLSDWLRDNP